MDNSEFESRAFANPDDSEQDFLDALQDNPQRQQFLNDIQSFNKRLSRITSSVTTPDGLSSRLKSAVDTDHSEEQTAVDTDTMVSFPRRSLQPMRLAAMAAMLVLVVGLAYSTLFGGNQPSAQELEFGQLVVNHVYAELEEINTRPGASYQQVLQTFGAVGASVASPEIMNSLKFTFAEPCSITPRNISAHLVIDGNAGAVNIIMVRSSPVNRRFRFSDERFEAVIIPMENGNLILIGDQNESFEEVQRELSDQVSWTI